MLRLAVPNKGALSEPATTMLREAGYATRSDSRQLVLRDEANNVEFFFLRPRDIAVYVGSGTLHAGITGRDLLLDSGAEANERLPLQFARSTFRFAAPAGSSITVSDLDGKRIATSYAGLVRSYLVDRGVHADVVRLDGAVETSVELGVADAIADVVETGSTLRAAGLATFGEPILQSEAVLITNSQDHPADLDILIRRVQGVLVARDYVLLDYDVRNDLLSEATDITPGLESPTVSPLHDSEWSAVRAMVKRPNVNKVMDDLYQLGARGILVTRIHACRL